MNEEKIIEVSKVIYEATRLEAEWSKRRIVPEKWEKRDDKFKAQFIDIIGKYLLLKELPTLEEVHNSWMESYIDMGWKYGEVRDVVERTYPDILPFDELPKDEKDKDAIFLAIVWAVKAITK